LNFERLDCNYHQRADFDCGEPSLNQFLLLYARQYRERGLGVTWVAVADDTPQRILGYYTLSMSAVSPEEFGNTKIHLPRIPVVLLGRLAVDLQSQGQGLGEELLLHALSSAFYLSQLIGAHAVVVDLINERVASFYGKYGFQQLPKTPHRMAISIKQIGKTLVPRTDAQSLAAYLADANRLRESGKPPVPASE